MPAIVDGDFQLTEAVPILAYLASKNHSPTATSSLLQTAKNASAYPLFCIQRSRSFASCSIGAGRPSLLGRDIKEEAQILQWCSFANQEYLPKLFPWLTFIF